MVARLNRLVSLNSLIKGDNLTANNGLNLKGPLDKKWGNIPPVLKGRFANSTYLVGKQNFFFTFPPNHLTFTGLQLQEAHINTSVSLAFVLLTALKALRFLLG